MNVPLTRPTTNHQLEGKSKDRPLALFVLTGEDKGKSIPLQKETRIVIGRGKMCDLVLKDTKMSREHAEIVFASGAFIITDLKSQNGMIVNQQKVLQASLSEGDKVIIGQTWFRIISDAERNSDLESESEELPQKKKSNKFVFYTLIGLAIFIVFIIPDNVEETKKHRSSGDETVKKLNEVNAELVRKISEKQKMGDKELQKNVGTILKRGLRELREKNYYRATLEFSHALDISPKDSQASFYLRRTYDEQDQAIKELSLAAARDIESLHLQRALVSYCAIMRLLYNFKQDRRYNETIEKIHEVEVKMGKEKGETKCY